MGGRRAGSRIHHPVAGDLELTGEALPLPADNGLTIITYTVEPHSTSEQALNFFASWSSHNLGGADVGDPARS